MLNKFSKMVELSRRRAREGHLGVLRQFGEMAILFAFRGVGPGYYQTAGWWRRGVDWRDKTLQLSASEYRRTVARLNPLPYRKLSQNKIPEKAILSLFGLPTPRFLGRLHAQTGRDFNGCPLRSGADLERLVRECRTERLVFKQLEGHGGKGVRIAALQLSSPVLCSAIGERPSQPLAQYCAATLQLGAGGDWLVEEYCDQHPEVAALNPSSVNTVRIWVLDRGKGDLQVVTAYLRIGRGDMFVDNASSGGIVAPIILETGRLRAAQDAHAEHNVYRLHPDHRAVIEGVELPHWVEVQRLAGQALSVFPRLRFAGLDIAIGPAGPVVVELNVSPDREAAAFTGCPTVTLLGGA